MSFFSMCYVFVVCIVIALFYNPGGIVLSLNTILIVEMRLKLIANQKWETFHQYSCLDQKIYDEK